ncbi:MAG: hypothetical protein QNK30_14585 [Bacteroidales bacterium]|nr:hypothetical protein [Bacteroidales bacterium]
MVIKYDQFDFAAMVLFSITLSMASGLYPMLLKFRPFGAHARFIIQFLYGAPMALKFCNPMKASG